MTKARTNCLLKQSKRFIRISRKGGKEERDAKNNYNRSLRCVNLWHNLSAKGRDTYARFDNKRLSVFKCDYIAICRYEVAQCVMGKKGVNE